MNIILFYTWTFYKQPFPLSEIFFILEELSFSFLSITTNKIANLFFFTQESGIEANKGTALSQSEEASTGCKAETDTVEPKTKVGKIKPSTSTILVVDLIVKKKLAYEITAQEINMKQGLDENAILILFFCQNIGQNVFYYCSSIYILSIYHFIYFLFVNYLIFIYLI